MKIDFEIVHPIHGKYRDALTLPDDHGFTDAEIDAMKQQRFDNWVAVVEAPPSDDILDIDGEAYAKLEGIPPAGAALKEVDGVWYYKV